MDILVQPAFPFANAIRLDEEGRVVWTPESQPLVDEAIRKAVLQDRKRYIQAVCPYTESLKRFAYNNNHRKCLVGGQLWAMCGAQRLVSGGIPEAEIVEALKAL